MSEHSLITMQSDDERKSIMSVARGAVAAGVTPKGVTEAQAYIILQSAMELGYPPMQALRSMHVIEGRLAMSSDAMLALAMRAGAVVVYHRADAEVCDLTLTRGQSSIRSTFTVGDAKRAGRWGKAGPWSQYPHAMLRARAVAFACRALFPDQLAGLFDPDEIQPAPAPAPTRPPPALPGGELVRSPEPLPEIEQREEPPAEDVDPEQDDPEPTAR